MLKIKKRSKYISSEIRTQEKIENLQRRGNESAAYYPVYINTGADHEYALFTETELNSALARGSKNREDTIPRADFWLTRLIKFIML